jgi:hypothetical protein
MESSPVMFATRVIPRTGISERTRAAVSAGAIVRCVPARKRFGARLAPVAPGGASRRFTASWACGSGAG